MSPETVVACRSCGGDLMEEVLSLGNQPLANSFRAPEDLAVDEPRYPLAVAVCRACSLLQLKYTVSPELLFSSYAYLSSTSSTMVAHARDLVQTVVERRRLGSDDRVIEVGSNDGYLLQHYRDYGVNVLGIEPAENIAREANERGIRTIHAFFGPELATTLRERRQLADVVHANNVMAHVPDINGFVSALVHVLQRSGRAIVETPYVVDLLDRCEFDTIYHEHVFYYSVTAIQTLVARHGLAVEAVERIPIHGGSIRVTLAHGDDATPDGSAERMVSEEEERGMRDPRAYRAFSSRVSSVRSRLRQLLADLKQEGASVAAYGAAAKGTVLLNVLGVDSETIDFVVDRNPNKQGRFMPGDRIPIRSPEELRRSNPQYLLLLTWNLRDEIMKQEAEYHRNGGQFIVPIPEPAIV